MPAFSHSFLKRRMALSIDSFSRTLTPVIAHITPNPNRPLFAVANSSSFGCQVKYFTVKMRGWKGAGAQLAVQFRRACHRQRVNPVFSSCRVEQIFGTALPARQRLSYSRLKDAHQHVSGALFM